MFVVELLKKENNSGKNGTGGISTLQDATSIHAAEGLLPLPAQSQQYGGDGHYTSRAGQGHRGASTQSQDWYLRGITGGALPEPNKMTSSRLLVCMFLTKVSSIVGSVLTAQLHWHSGENTRIGRSIVCCPFSSQMRAGSH